ncbi:exodeoxyribonuclease VII large subunit [Amaricoccus sp.]|uniref:exodeoxyribonuclease VII large subunit n=1 Tax=Amaricoccus sp. TaxID=1872485 RepID=UPI001B758023|nr:exodeoxyribonuclease VII large subunit [Amaricoccus sp.]MBP7001668.1 exodeoxyribonuclease VII large subunit [Amaricoccus sp.]
MDLFEPDGPGSPGGNVPELTVGEISGAVKRAIEGGFGHVRVRGEVGRVSRPGSGHIYLDLKDDRACLGAVVWRTSVRGLAVQPQEGMEVVATGRLTTFPGASKYQMVIEQIAHAGVGALLAMLEKRKAALAAEGLFDPGRKRPLPFLPETIGVVTSPSGAVIRDILHRLAERFPRRVLVWPAAVQGPNCAAEVAAAIRGFDAMAPGGPAPRPDLLIVARGGGSIEDLWGFNEEAVLRAAAACRIPLISAVGHETDNTLLDLVADRRAPTPTAAAEMAVPVRLDLLAGLAGLETRRRGALSRGLDARRQRLRDLARGLPRGEALVAERAQRLDGLALRLPRALVAAARERRLRLAQGAGGRLSPALLARAVERQRARLEALAPRLPRALGAAAREGRLRLAQGAAGRLAPALLARAIAARRERLERVAAGLDPGRREREIGRLGERLAAAAARLERVGAGRLAQGRVGLDGLARALDRAGPARLAAARGALGGWARLLATLGPEATLARGFAIVRDEAGRVLTRAADARAAAGLEIELADGRVAARPEAGAGPAPRPGAVARPRRGGRESGGDPGQGSLL